MRLDASRFGILACLSGLVGAQGGDAGSAKTVTTDIGTTSTSSASSNVVIELEPLPTPAVYAEGVGDQNITYSHGIGFAGVTVTAVNLRRYSDNVTIGMGKDYSAVLNTGSELHTGEAIIGRRDETLPPFSFPITNGSVTLKVPSSDLSRLYGDNVGLPLYYEFEWKNSTSSGKSYSQLIAVALSNGYNNAVQMISKTGKDSSPAFTEDIQQDATNPLDATSTSGSTAAETSLASTSASSRGSGGLGPGPIAGIAVGCAVVVILIVAFLVWFFFFRRRGSRDPAHGQSGFAANSGSKALVLDKEATGSPQSAYPDDGGRLRDADAYASYAGTKAPQAPGAAFTMNSTSDLASIGQASTTRAATPPAYQTRYAHLIEEGMTEDEIRRLEEEERHLDAAIQNAERNPRRDTH
ncbi:uncharacterized protein GGS22DRAFT_41926 [Annulohypoxylon maeteangense]|uniref:uncharacterized protein n=1 Tax=Annulohypoxylon maeteangense TaxID=1927788 RepID=UPI0020082A34|nr:uncharacterized protein GGS22DRAFT_41926 [Annulohypoxylon maeteangense]KAI0882863.1 hypothetical protein GGS22DRAFT_41926 [Annulohypoxylon maeteangense]